MEKIRGGKKRDKNIPQKNCDKIKKVDMKNIRKKSFVRENNTNI